MPTEYVLLIAKEGASVNSTNPLDFILNTSIAQTVKMSAKIQSSVSVPAYDLVTVTISHGLSFAPLSMIAVELKPGTGKFFFGTAGAGNSDSDGGGLNVVDAYTTSTSLKIVLSNNEGSSKTIRFAYIIFADNGR